MPHSTPTSSEAMPPGPCDTGAALTVPTCLMHSAWPVCIYAGMLSVHVSMSEQGSMHCSQEQSHLMLPGVHLFLFFPTAAQGPAVARTGTAKQGWK